MSIQCQENVNFLAFGESFRKTINNYKTFFSHIKKYYDTVTDYQKKLNSLYEGFIKSFQEPTENMTETEIEYNKIILSLVDSFGQILSTHIESCKDRADGLSEILYTSNPNINQWNKDYDSIYKEYKTAYTDLLNYYKKVGGRKAEFFKAAELSEETLERICQLKIAKENQKNMGILAEMENKRINQNIGGYLSDLKNRFSEYKNILQDSKKNEENYLNKAKSTTEDMNKLTTKVLEDLKGSIIYLNVFERSSCSKIKMITETTFPTLDKFNVGTSYSNYVTNSTFTNLPFTPTYLKKYQPKILDKFYKIKGNLNFDDLGENNNEYLIEAINKKNSEEDSENLSFENMNHIIETLYANIKEGLDDQYDVELEKKKYNLYTLCKKILTKEKSTLTEEEISLLQQYLINRELRKFFLQNLNLFRTKGKFEIPKENFDIIAQFLNIILGFLDKDNLDFYCARGAIILSQTFYYIEESSKKKVYLQEKISSHVLIKDKLFWQNFLIGAVEGAIKNNPLTRERKLSDFEGNEAETESKEKNEYLANLANIAFGQIVTIANNMKDFGFDKNTIKEIEVPLMNKYKLPKDKQDAILGILE
ncbi:MAG: hypothetical protein MJ252_26355 [archaeon]|nr:hypothetical protein [archaeon]